MLIFGENALWCFYGTDSRLPRFFWARRKMFAKFREMILKNLAIAKSKKRDTKEKRYNPMFYPSYQAEDGKWYFVLNYNWLQIIEIVIKIPYN